MTKLITIGDAEVGMSATGSSPIRFRNIFGKDFLAETTKENPDPYLYVQMGFIMASAYEKRDMSSLTEEDFFEWADQFAPMDILNAVAEIGQLWSKSQKTTVTGKKRQG